MIGTVVFRFLTRHRAPVRLRHPPTRMWTVLSKIFHEAGCQENVLFYVSFAVHPKELSGLHSCPKALVGFVCRQSRLHRTWVTIDCSMTLLPL